MTYFPKKILRTSHSPFFGHQVMKFCHKKECLQPIFKIHLMKWNLTFFIPIIKILGIFVESLDIVTHVTSNK
jgi:hypothetical protein